MSISLMVGLAAFCSHSFRFTYPMGYSDLQLNRLHIRRSYMDLVISITVVLFAWRFLLSLASAVAFALPIGLLFGAVGGFSVVLVGIGFGCIWQGRWLSGIPLFASVPAPAISKPVAFLGFAFIGAIWGGFASELLGSVLAGAFALIACVAAVGAWQTLYLKRHELLGNLVFSSLSLLFGLGSLSALNSLRA